MKHQIDKSTSSRTLKQNKKHSAVRREAKQSLTTSQSAQRTPTRALLLSTMCLILSYNYTCAPAHTETLFRPCRMSAYAQTRTQTQATRSSEDENGFADQRDRLRELSLASNNPYLAVCPQTWQKTIYPPMCNRCVARGRRGRRGEGSWSWDRTEG